MTDDIQIFEVSPRDGLQNEWQTVPTATKLQLIERLSDAGIRDIEVTSFVRPSRIPQLADAAELVAALPPESDTRFWALVPNQIGLDRALDVGVRHVCTFLSSSETHNKKNVNRTIRESISGLREVIGTAVAEELDVRAYISTVFGCPFEGDVPVARVVDIAHAMLEAGAGVIALGDTTGMAVPEQVKTVVRTLVAAGIPVDRLALHTHDTRGTALVNAYAGWQAGLRKFDGSVAGIGGCPYAPGAAGNAATEDLVHMFHGIGESTGIDLEALAESGDFMSSVLSRPLPGRYHQFWQAQRERRSRQSA